MNIGKFPVARIHVLAAFSGILAVALGGMVGAETARNATPEPRACGTSVSCAMAVESQSVTPQSVYVDPATPTATPTITPTSTATPVPPTPTATATPYPATATPIARVQEPPPVPGGAFPPNVERWRGLVAEFFPGQVDFMLALIACESSGDPGEIGREGERGLTQIHPVHNEWASAFDPRANLAAAYRISGGGKDFDPWPNCP